MKQRPFTTLLNFFGSNKSQNPQGVRRNVLKDKKHTPDCHKNCPPTPSESQGLPEHSRSESNPQLPMDTKEASQTSFQRSLAHRRPSKRFRRSILTSLDDGSDEEKKESSQDVQESVVSLSLPQKSSESVKDGKVDLSDSPQDQKISEGLGHEKPSSMTPFGSDVCSNVVEYNTSTPTSFGSHELKTPKNVFLEAGNERTTPHHPSLNTDDSLLLNDIALSNSQNSGLSGHDDPTPIPIPRLSVSSTSFSASISPPSSFRQSDVLSFSPTGVTKEETREMSETHHYGLTVEKEPNEVGHQRSTDHSTGMKSLLTTENRIKQKSMESFFVTRTGPPPSVTTIQETQSNVVGCVAAEPKMTHCLSVTSLYTEKPLSLPKDLLEKMSVGIKTSTTTGSLFGSVWVNEKSHKSDSMSCPFFDPACFVMEELSNSDSCGDYSSRFSYVAHVFNSLEEFKGSGTGSKKKAVLTLTNLYRLILWYSPNDVIPLTYICLNRVAPLFMNVELGVGESLLLKVLTEVYGRSEKSLKADLIKYEDLGKVAELCRSKMRVLIKPQRLTISSVFHELKNLSDISGQIAQTKKKDKIKKLLVAAESCEAKYIIRFLQAKMRMGIQAITIYQLECLKANLVLYIEELMQALAYAFVLTHPKTTDMDQKSKCSDTRRDASYFSSVSAIETELNRMDEAVRAAISQTSNVEQVINALFKGLSSTDLEAYCSIQSGIPVQPMLAKPTKGIQEILQKFGTSEFTCEYKYDGERAQIHLKPDGTVIFFSRNLETITEKYPDVIETIKSCFKPDTKECILDSEIVAFDPETQRILSFQVLSTRKRKKVELKSECKVHVCLFLFDCLQFNGTSLLKCPLVERRHYLNKCITESPGHVCFVCHKEMSNFEDVDAFLQEAIEANCEGLMIKTLKEHAFYDPSKRSSSWLKLKKDYLENLTDSFDLVLMGAYFGRGKRCKVYGAFLLGCFNEEEETFQTICKAGTGFSDELLEAFYEKLQTSILTTKHTAYHVHDKMHPDVWLEPRYVWEIRAADLSISPVHTASLGVAHLSKGIALRFPRFIRCREDKLPEQATSAYQVFEMYKSQTFSQRDECSSHLPVTEGNQFDSEEC